MEIRFHKMHGTLNDFVVFHDLNGSVSLSPGQVVRMCDRRAGVGADGVIAVRRSANADFFMDYLNADGSVAEMCGNGIRCLAKYVYDHGLTDKKTLPVETRAGVKILELLPGRDGKVERVRVNMGRPIFDAASIPVSTRADASPILDYPLEVAGQTFRCSLLSMGNPHCVIAMDEIPEDLPRTIGPLIERHPLFPAKTNVEFVRVDDPGRLVMKVWERGSGETLSCGTGACASAVAMFLKGLTRPVSTVVLPGGELEIEWKGDDSEVIMTGPVVEVYSGLITI